jgi:hypothetical protein
MQQLLVRLTSRKFLLALAALIVCVANANVPGAIAVTLAYLGVEGANDFVSTKQQGQ